MTGLALIEYERMNYLLKLIPKISIIKIFNYLHRSSIRMNKLFLYKETKNTLLKLFNSQKYIFILIFFIDGYYIKVDSSR